MRVDDSRKFGARECPACACEVEANQNRCPICGYEFPAPSALQRGLKWGGAFLMLLLLLLVLLWGLL